jgi:uncharacterized protein DUF4412
MSLRLDTVSAVLVAAVAISVAHAGTVIQQQEVAPGTSQTRQQVTVYVDSGKLRVEGNNPASGKYLLIFDDAKQVTWMVDFAKGTYMEFTAAQVQSMAGGMQAAMQQMQAQMANLPPDQRAMMEQMMKQRMGGMAGGAPPTKTVRQKATGQKVGQFTCTSYEVMSDGQLSQEVCAAPSADLKLDPAAFETFKALAKFYEPLTSQIPKGTWSAPSAMDQIQGFPVQTLIYVNGQPSMEWQLVSVENKALDGGLFALPAGLKKMEMPQMPSMAPPMGRPGARP